MNLRYLLEKLCPLSFSLTDQSRGSDGASQRSHLALSDGSFRKERRSISAFSHLAPSEKKRNPTAQRDLTEVARPASYQLSSPPRPFCPPSSNVSSRSERQSILAFHASPPLTDHSGGSDGSSLWVTLESFARNVAQTAQCDSFRRHKTRELLPNSLVHFAYFSPFRRFIRYERQSVPVFSRFAPLDDIPKRAKEGSRPELPSATHLDAASI